MASLAAEAHRDAQIKLRDVTSESVGRLWDSLPDHSDGGLASFIQLAVPLVHAGSRQAIRLVDGYFAQEMDRRPYGLNENELIASVRAGVGSDEVYKRSFITLWSLLKDGEWYANASGQARADLITRVRTDLLLASTHAARAVATRDPGIDALQRVPRGTCDLCLDALAETTPATGLQSVHPGCECAFEPQKPKKALSPYTAIPPTKQIVFSELKGAFKSGTFNDAEIKAYNDWQVNGISINQQIRAGTTTAETEAKVQTLDAMMEKAGPIGSPVKVYRGVQKTVKEILSDEHGNSFTDAGFGSTAESRSLAESFGFGNQHTMFELTIDPKLKAIYSDIGEAELTLERGARYFIRSIERRDDGPDIVTADVMPPEVVAPKELGGFKIGDEVLSSSGLRSKVSAIRGGNLELESMEPGTLGQKFLREPQWVKPAPKTELDGFKVGEKIHGKETGKSLGDIKRIEGDQLVVNVAGVDVNVLPGQVVKAADVQEVAPGLKLGARVRSVNLGQGDVVGVTDSGQIRVKWDVSGATTPIDVDRLELVGVQKLKGFKIGDRARITEPGYEEYPSGSIEGFTADGKLVFKLEGSESRVMIKPEAVSKIEAKAAKKQGDWKVGDKVTVSGGGKYRIKGFNKDGSIQIKPIRGTENARPYPTERSVQPEEVFRQLTDDQWAALHEYIDGLYRTINAYFRSKKAFANLAHYVNMDTLKAQMGAIQRAARYDRYTGTVYRGMDLDSASPALRSKLANAENNIGGTFTDRGYMSTSVQQNFADGWSYGPNAVTLDIKMVNNHCCNFFARGMNESEGEILLPRGNTYRITGVDYRGSRKVIHLEVASGSSKAE